MTPVFTQKRLNSEEQPGEKLRQARSNKHLTLSEIAAKTGIRAEYLLALENENYSALPSGLYSKQYFKEYAVFLGLDPEEIIKKYKLFSSDNQLAVFNQKILTSKNFLVFPKIARNLLLILIILACFFYLGFYLLKSQEAPSLVIDYPTENLATAESQIIISGKTDKEAELTINGELVLTNEQGNFSLEINLKKGLNEIIIISKKKHGRPQIIQRQILVQ